MILRINVCAHDSQNKQLYIVVLGNLCNGKELRHLAYTVYMLLINFFESVLSHILLCYLGISEATEVFTSICEGGRV